MGKVFCQVSLMPSELTATYYFRTFSIFFVCKSTSLLKRILRNILWRRSIHQYHYSQTDQSLERTRWLASQCVDSEATFKVFVYGCCSPRGSANGDAVWSIYQALHHFLERYWMDCHEILSLYSSSQWSSPNDFTDPCHFRQEA